MTPPCHQAMLCPSFFLYQQIPTQSPLSRMLTDTDCLKITAWLAYCDCVGRVSRPQAARSSVPRVATASPSVLPPLFANTLTSPSILFLSVHPRFKTRTRNIPAFCFSTLQYPVPTLSIHLVRTRLSECLHPHNILHLRKCALWASQNLALCFSDLRMHLAANSCARSTVLLRHKRWIDLTQLAEQVDTIARTTTDWAVGTIDWTLWMELGWSPQQ